MAHKARNKIGLIACEMEGGWDEGREPDNLEGDGSVDVPDAYHIGEIQSAPMATLEELQRWIRTNYPQHVNSTCGLHFHLSFKRDSDYARLMREDFRGFFRGRLEAWANRKIHRNSCFWGRFRGRNSYCEDQFFPERQVNHHTKGYHRYTQLNYCWGVHGTLECRVFPMFKDPAISAKAAAFLWKTVNEYLDGAPKIQVAFTERVYAGLRAEAACGLPPVIAGVWREKTTTLTFDIREEESENVSNLDL